MVGVSGGCGGIGSGGLRRWCTGLSDVAGGFVDDGGIGAGALKRGRSPSGCRRTTGRGSHRTRMRALVARPRSVGKARGHDPAPQPAVRCKHPVIADEVNPGSGYQSGEFCELIEGVVDL